MNEIQDCANSRLKVTLALYYIKVIICLLAGTTLQFQNRSMLKSGKKFDRLSGVCIRVSDHETSSLFFVVVAKQIRNVSKVLPEHLNENIEYPDSVSLYGFAAAIFQFAQS